MMRIHINIDNEGVIITIAAGVITYNVFIIYVVQLNTGF